MKDYTHAKDGTLTVLIDEKIDAVEQVVVSRKGSIYGKVYLPPDDDLNYRKWEELRETITELRDNNAEKEDVALILGFLLNLMNVKDGAR